MRRSYAIVSRWGAACGISLHGELLAWGLRRLGYDVLVYAPTLETASKDWHHVLVEEDAPWVRRVYGEVEEVEFPEGGFFKPDEKFYESDVIVVEGYQRLPWLKLREHIVRARRRGAATLLVVHFTLPRDLEPVLDDPSIWDAVLVFDERYTRMVYSVAGDSVRVAEVPYPHLILETSEEDRPSFDGVVVFSFGRQPPHEYVDYIRGVKRLVDRGYRILYRVVRSLGRIGYRAPWFHEEERRLDVRSLYAALRGSDVHLLPKWESPGIVVSSTLAQVLYSGTPTVVPDTRYFETIPDALSSSDGVVVKYRLGDVRDFVDKLELLLNDESLVRRVSENARRYALERSPERVASLVARIAG